MKARIARLAAGALLVLLVSIGLESISEALATPLLFGLWILQRVVASVPQGAFWAIPVIAGALLTVRVFRHKGGRTASDPAMHRLRPEGIRVWADLLVKARERGYFRWRLAKDLSPLFLEAFGARQIPADHPGEGRPQPGLLDLPAELNAYLGAATSTKSYRQYLEEGVGRGPSSPLNLDPERVVQYLEDAIDPPWISAPSQRKSSLPGR